MTLTRRGTDRFYRCINWTTCRGSHGAHPSGRPLGIEAPARVRKKRQEVHELAARIWPWEDREAKKAMYLWMRRHAEERHHIGEMMEGELNRLADLLRAEISRGSTT